MVEGETTVEGVVMVMEASGEVTKAGSSAEAREARWVVLVMEQVVVVVMVMVVLVDVVRAMVVEISAAEVAVKVVVSVDDWHMEVVLMAAVVIVVTQMVDVKE